MVFVNKTTLFMSFFTCYVFAGKAQGCERNEDVVTYGDLSESTDNAVFRNFYTVKPFILSITNCTKISEPMGRAASSSINFSLCTPMV